MKPHPYLALAAHLEELRTARSADNKPWASVAPLCLATIGMGLIAPEKLLLKVEKALLMAKDSCAGLDEVWAAWVEKHDPWKRRPEEEGMPNHGWELATLFASSPNATVLKALLASPSAPSATAIESGLHAHHSLAQRDDSRVLVGEAWAVPLNLLGCVVSHSAWNTNASDVGKVTSRILDAVDVLLAHGVDINASVTTGGRRALGLANHPQLVQGLLERGADPFALDDRGVPALATFWEGPALLGDGRAQAMTAFWREQAAVPWTVEAWRAWCGMALEKVVTSNSRASSAVFGWKTHRDVMATLFQQGVAMEGEYGAFVRQQGPEQARRLLLASRQNKKPVPDALAPLSWWPTPASPVPQGHWLLMAQAFSLPTDGKALDAALSRRMQEDLVGTIGREEALRAMAEQLGRPPADAMAMVQAWCQAISVLHSVGRETFFSTLWPNLAAASLDFCQTVSTEELADASRWWASSENKGLKSALETELKKHLASGRAAQWPLEGLFLASALAGGQQEREASMNALAQRPPHPETEQRLEVLARWAPKTWSAMGLKESLAQRRLDMQWAEQPVSPRPRF